MNVHDEFVAQVAFRAEKWWHTDNNLKIAVDKLNLSAAEKDWIGEVAIQAWTEGAIIAVQEYGDELRKQGFL